MKENLGPLVEVTKGQKVKKLPVRKIRHSTPK